MGTGPRRRVTVENGLVKQKLTVIIVTYYCILLLLSLSVLLLLQLDFI